LFVAALDFRVPLANKTGKKEESTRRDDWFWRKIGSFGNL
jgi:hypothetical protein